MTFKVPIFDSRRDVDSIYIWLKSFFGRFSGDDLVKTRVIPLSDWDMDTISSITVDMGNFIIPTQIVDYNVIIYDDSLSKAYNPCYIPGSFVTVDIDNQTINLERTNGGFFDSVNFDDTSINRGYVVIYYII